jgi:hypothetical protein
MVVSIRSEATLALGKRLVDQLDLADSADTLGRWMAHHVAELIVEAEQASARDRSAKMRKCRDAVLSLWEHRRALPNGQRPFEDLEPIMRAVASLDPNQEASRHFPTGLLDEAKGASVDPAERWLRTARDVDYMAKLLIRQCLVQAAADAIDKSAAWVALAHAATFDAREEAVVLRMLSAERGVSAAELADEAVQEQLDRIARLEDFAGLAADLATEMKHDLNKLAKRRRSHNKPQREAPTRKGRKPDAALAQARSKMVTLKSGLERTQQRPGNASNNPETPSSAKKSGSRTKGRAGARAAPPVAKRRLATSSNKSKHARVRKHPRHSG